MKKVLLFLLLLPLCLFAKQTTIVGDVLSATTGEPIPNANVYYLGTQTGTSTDADGSFALITDETKERTLIISALGYHRERYTIAPGAMAGIQVLLRERAASLEEVVALPGANEALPLIAAVRAHRSQNDRQQHSDWQADYTDRTQLYVSNINRQHLYRLLWSKVEGGFIYRADSSALLPLYTSSQPVSLHGEQLHPTGPADEHALILSSSDYTTLLDVRGNINFYRSDIYILGQTFLSPLANNGTRYYNYYLVDSVATPNGKQYEVHFRTRNPYFATFNGEMFIDSATYALRAIEARVPIESGINYLNRMHIQARYAADNMPVEETMAVLLDFSVKADTINHIFPTLMLQKQLCRTDSLAHPIPSQSLLSEQLPVAEALNYLDSIPLIRTAQWLAYTISTGYMPTGYLEIGPWERLLSLNRHETVHLGAAIRTSPKLWQNVCLEGSFGYGFRDRDWKGHGAVRVALPTPRRHILSAEYHDEYRYLDEQHNLLNEGDAGLALGHFLTHALELFKQEEQFVHSATREQLFSVESHNDWNDLLETHLWARVGRTGYNDVMLGYHAMPQYRHACLGGTIRLGWGEKKVDSYFQRRYLYGPYPALEIGLETGSWQMEGMKSYRMYGRLTLTAHQCASLGQGGTLDWALQGGLVLGNVPYPMLHIFRGNQSYTYDPYGFTLMNHMQYLNDKWISLHLEWNGKGVLFNRIPGIRYLRLRELLTFKLAYGGISSANSTLAASMLADKALARWDSRMEIPYMEAGIGLGNILRCCDLYSVWRLGRKNENAAPIWALRFRIHVGM